MLLVTASKSSHHRGLLLLFSYGSYEPARFPLGSPLRSRRMVMLLETLSQRKAGKQPAPRRSGVWGWGEQ